MAFPTGPLPPRPRAVEPHPSDRYWRLTTYDNEPMENMKSRLQQAGCYGDNVITKRRRFFGRPSWEDLIEWSEGLDRGLLWYPGFSDVELRKFINDRCIVRDHPSTDVKTASKPELIGILDAADDTATLPQMKRLPAEVRCNIYRYYMAGFRLQDLWGPMQPPVTRTSRLLRQEALPIFYQCCNFHIHLKQSPFSKKTLQLTPPSQCFLLSLPATLLAEVRWIAIHVEIVMQNRITKFTIWLEFKNVQGEDVQGFTITDDAPQNRPAETLARFDAMRKSLKVYYQDRAMTADSERSRGIEDLREARKIVEKKLLTEWED